MTTIINSLAIALYLAAAAYQARYLLSKSGQPPKRTLLIGTALTATCFHAAGVFLSINSLQGIDLGFFKISSLLFCFISVLSISFTLRRPTDNLLIALLPLAAIAIVAASLSAPTVNLDRKLSTGIMIHIISSILAYSVMTIAVIQACALSLQEKQLKSRHSTTMLRALPPLQTMEAMLFELIWIGAVLLSLSIVSGILFIDDIFAQHLVHKSSLTIAAWCIFTILLWGRHQLGWRSQTAVRWTIGGFIALMLGYFGSKLVLELILQRI